MTGWVSPTAAAGDAVTSRVQVRLTAGREEHQLGGFPGDGRWNLPGCGSGKTAGLCFHDKLGTSRPQVISAQRGDQRPTLNTRKPCRTVTSSAGCPAAGKGRQAPQSPCDTTHPRSPHRGRRTPRHTRASAVSLTPDLSSHPALGCPSPSHCPKPERRQDSHPSSPLTSAPSPSAPSGGG